MLLGGLVALPLVALLALSSAAPAFHAHHFHAGQKLVATFTPSSNGAQLAFSFCTDMDSTQCHVVNLVGYKDGRLAAFFFRKGESLSEPAHQDHSHEGHTHSEHAHSDHAHADHAHADHAHSEHAHADHAHSEHADHAHHAAPAALQEDLNKAVSALRVAAAGHSADPTPAPSVLELAAPAFAWLPQASDAAVQEGITPLSLVYTDANLGMWEPVREYVITLQKGDGKLKVGLEGAEAISWPMADAYMHSTGGVRLAQGSLTVTGPAAA